MDTETMKAIEPYAKDALRLDDLVKEKETEIKRLESVISLLKDEGRMRARIIEQSNEICRLHERIRNVRGDIVRAAKRVVDIYTDDLSKISLPEDKNDGISNKR